MINFLWLIFRNSQWFWWFLKRILKKIKSYMNVYILRHAWGGVLWISKYVQQFISNRHPSVACWILSCPTSIKDISELRRRMMMSIRANDISVSRPFECNNFQEKILNSEKVLIQNVRHSRFSLPQRNPQKGCVFKINC